MNDQDHDLLVRIDTKLDMVNKNFINHCEDAAGRFIRVEESQGKLHKRHDDTNAQVGRFLVAGVLAIVTLAITLGVILWTK